MALKLYPVGIQTFEEIIKRNLLYIDKTEYIYRMTHSGGKYFFLRRPRRFGKSLLVSTFESYFSGKKELFEGLAIEKLEKDWTEYPVLHFDMSGGKHMEKEQLEEYLGFVLNKQEKVWGIEKPVAGANNRLTDLIDTAYEKTGKQVVVLIDEYDAPMLDVAHEKESLDALRNVMRNFYSPLKMCEAKLRFVFLTGITKFSQVSIFSELNNIKNISMDDEYAGICGITKEELLTQMSEDIDALADALKISREEAIAKLKENYQQVLFIIFSLLTDYLVDVEVHTPSGRVDIVMLSRTHLYIIEIKMDKDAQTAMQQIDLKDYRQRFALCGNPIVKVGINFDAKKGNIEDWKIEE